MINIIEKVKIDSIAEEVGIECGDKLLSINGNEIKDIIDYRFLIADDYLEIEVQKNNLTSKILQIYPKIRQQIKSKLT